MPGGGEAAAVAGAGLSWAPGSRPSRPPPASVSSLRFNPAANGRCLPEPPGNTAVS